MNSLFVRTNQIRMIDLIGHRGGFFIGNRWSLSWRERRFVSEGYPLEGPCYSWSFGEARSSRYSTGPFISNETHEHYYFGGRNISGMLNQIKDRLKMVEKLDKILASLGETAERK